MTIKPELSIWSFKINICGLIIHITNEFTKTSWETKDLG